MSPFNELFIEGRHFFLKKVVVSLFSHSNTLNIQSNAIAPKKHKETCKH